tara:strand:+ start:3198 stop:3431 length:234 start_codon:yes stop_codon:yes gene_type:complete
MIVNQDVNTKKGHVFFNWRERFQILLFGKVVLGQLALKKYGNCLMKLLIEYNESFDDVDIKNYLNTPTDHHIRTEWK